MIVREHAICYPHFMNIRMEIPSDSETIHSIVASAFETDAEANLVDKLRRTANPFWSIVAEAGGALVGHVLVTPVTLDGAPEGVQLMGLAPLAVLPSHQKQGAGAALMKAAINKCKSEGVVAIVLLGNPAYYSRFGFVTSADYGIKSEYDVPPEYFMILPLDEEAIAEVVGRVKYHAAFGEL